MSGFPKFEGEAKPLPIAQMSGVVQCCAACHRRIYDLHETRRFEAARDLAAATISNCNWNGVLTDAVEDGIKAADALLAELARTKEGK